MRKLEYCCPSLILYFCIKDMIRRFFFRVVVLNFSDSLLYAIYGEESFIFRFDLVYLKRTANKS